VNIRIAGIGKTGLGDDGFGCEVLRRLAARPPRDGVRAIDFGIRGIDLSYALLDPPDLTIFVDAMPRGGPPGALYTLEPDLTAVDSEGAGHVDMHEMNPMRVLRMVKSMGGAFGRVLLVGCEPMDCGDELEGRMGLSRPVARAVDGAVEIIESLVEKNLLEAAA
jgi:hydrogenase maturation protease